MAREEDPCYIISVVAKMVEMHPQTIRHYERLGFVAPSRTQGKMRLYSERDVERLARISHLTRDMGVNLAGVEVIFNLLDEMEKLRHAMMEEMERKAREKESEIQALRKKIQGAVKHHGRKSS